MRMRAQVAVVALSIGLVVSGCTTDDRPTGPTTAEPTATVTTTPTPSPTPSPTFDVTVPPERPEAMATPSADGAAAAATYFMSLYAYMYASGDTSAWREMSAETCTFCKESAADAEQLAADGKRDATPIDVVSAEGIELTPKEWFKARLVVVQPPTVETDEAGNEVQTSDGGRFDVDFAMTWNRAWIIDSVGIEPVTD